MRDRNVFLLRPLPSFMRGIILSEEKPTQLNQAYRPKGTNTMNLTILARIAEFDIELTFDVDEFNEVAIHINNLVEQAPEIKPRPRFQGNQPKVDMPFNGIIEKQETVPAKDGKKPYNLAHVKAPNGELVPVKFWAPLRTWPVGMEVTVTKGEYGPMLEDKPSEQIPF